MQRGLTLALPLLRSPGSQAKAEVCSSLAVCPPTTPGHFWLQTHGSDTGDSAEVPPPLAFSALPEPAP